MPAAFIMRDKPVRLLSTRPLDEAIVERVASDNILVNSISFINVVKKVTDEVAARLQELSNETATVVFTSMNAVEIVVAMVPENEGMPEWNIYCIGGATFTLVKKYWPYNSILYTAKNAAELAIRIAEDKPEKIVFFCGNKRREELPGLLARENIELDEIVVYETIETPKKVEGYYDGILFFSPSAVKSYFSKNNPLQQTVFFAIGNTTAHAIKQFSGNSIIVSDFPAKDHLVDKAVSYFSEKR